MKNKLLIISLLGVITVSAQQNGKVGVNTTTPQVTLDIQGEPANAAALDGLRAPQITGAQLRAKTYTSSQTGTLMYVSAADTVPSGQTIDVTASGYYYFNGAAGINRWIPINLQAAPTEPWYNAANNQQATANTQNIYQTGNVGIKTTNPLYPLHIASYGGNLTHPKGGLMVEGDDNGSRISVLYNGNATIQGGFNTFQAYRSRGTKAAPSAVINGDKLLEITGFGYDGTSYQTGGDGTIRIDATENFSTGNGGYRIVFSTSPNGTQDPIDRVVVDNTGNLGIFTSTPNSSLQVSGSFSANIGIKSSGTLTDKDYTVRVRGNLTLPDATTCNCVGRIYNLINNRDATSTISGKYINNDGTFSADNHPYALDNSDGRKAITVQNAGDGWLIISKY